MSNIITGGFDERHVYSFTGKHIEIRMLGPGVMYEFVVTAVIVEASIGLPMAKSARVLRVRLVDDGQVLTLRYVRNRGGWKIIVPKSQNTRARKWHLSVEGHAYLFVDQETLLQVLQVHPDE